MRKLPPNTLKILDEFNVFFERTNAKITKIAKIHEKHLVCKKGCTNCCMNISVFPIEFYAIGKMLKKAKKKIKLNRHKRCSFLQDCLCMIYQFRPILCRTHGLPLSHRDSHDPSRANIAICELNFANKTPKFKSDNVLDMDEINLELYRLNEKFIAKFKTRLPVRIPLSKVIAYAKGKPSSR
ncbi:MAG: YkgJ family cysteine cluster protein [Candidatus Delongbacteria bacterium]|nr:YkgJ family cysteine cluster protein [Candidatus Delongbacteria bacterium]